VSDSNRPKAARNARHSTPGSLASALSRTKPVRYLKSGVQPVAPERPAASTAEAEEPHRFSKSATGTTSFNGPEGRPAGWNSARANSDAVAGAENGTATKVTPLSPPAPAEPAKLGLAQKAKDRERAHLQALKSQVMPEVFEQIDYSALVGTPREDVTAALKPLILNVAARHGLSLNNRELIALQEAMVDEIIGFGPLEPLLADETVADILVNGAEQVFAERNGKLERTEILFRDDDHVLQVANRICNWVGRRVDVSTPMADARLPDGSRVNIIIPPLALRGPSISVRKFNKHKMELMDLAERGAMSKQMASFLKIATSSRLNILISGGTGSGKTTLLNALSQYIDPGERIVTIEDSAELQLHQPHLVPLETRPPNLEGTGEVTIRDLLINALRMRPDRIIVGEVRGEECFDMLQAFNTGHDGGMCTLHANRPREALSRLENLVAMGNPNYPTKAVRQQIAETIDIIVQVKRMRGGIRRVTDIVEVVGLDGDVITTQPLFGYELKEVPDGEAVEGRFVYSGIALGAAPRVMEAGLGSALKEVLR